jgi:uncharacterized membrane protein YccC
VCINGVIGKDGARLSEESKSPGAGIGARLARHALEWRLSLRILASAMLTYTVAELLQLEQVFWAVLTSVIVMQASLGGSMKAMVDRCSGTIVGGFFGIAIGVTMPRNGPVSTGLALLMALVPVAVLVAFKPAYRVAPVTAAIVVLAYRGPHGALASGLLRVFEIGLGSLVAFIVALVVFPARAHQLLQLAARDALVVVGDEIHLLFGDLGQVPDRSMVLALHDRRRGAVERANALAQEAARERASRVSDAPDPEPLVRTLRRLDHDLVMMARLRATPLPEPIAGRLAPVAAEIASTAGGLTAALGAVLAGGGELPTMTEIDNAVAAYREATTALHRDGSLHELPNEAVEQVYGLAFALEQFGRNLGDFRSRTAECTAP